MCPSTSTALQIPVDILIPTLPRMNTSFEDSPSTVEIPLLINSLENVAQVASSRWTNACKTNDI